MRPRSTIVLVLLTLIPGVLQAQTTPVVGLRDNQPGVHALTNARIVVSPGNVVSNGTIVLRDGVIEAVGANVNAPADARVWDMSGRTIYPGFIDAYAAVGMRTELSEEELADERGAVYWNPQVRSGVDAALDFAVADTAGPLAMRNQGFTVALSVPRLGMFRGQAAVVSLGRGSVAERVIRPAVAHSLVMSRDRQLGGGYPSSGMGAMAFIRQTLLDAQWHTRTSAAYQQNPVGMRRPEANVALLALRPVLDGAQPLLVETGDEEEALRALRLADEFDLNVWLRGSGSEYQMIDRFRGLDVPLILPVDFPQAPDAATVEQSLGLDLGELRHWRLAPSNPALLAQAGVTFALTSDGLADRSRFLPNVRTAVQRGLAPDVALAALTTVPAGLLGIGRTHGTLERGRVANLVVADGDLFSGTGDIESVWVDGQEFGARAPARLDTRGDWRITSVGDVRLDGTLELRGTASNLSGEFVAEGQQVQLSSARLGGETNRLHIAFPGDVLAHEGTIRMSGTATENSLSGWGEFPDGSRFNWTAERVGAAPAAAADDAPETPGGPPVLPGDLDVAAIEFGRTSIPAQPEHVLVRNATLWTMGGPGRIENADLLVTRGRVAQVGQNLSAPSGAQVIDGTGKHVTPGLIDPHIHSGASGGINEGGNAIVPEVQLGDMLTTDNIWIYRQLAGGLTTAHVMHGSANPIGGQNEHIKLRLGAGPEELKFDGAPRTVKFALGENPKRNPNRYPNTRMGTEQIIRDHFLAAREYERARAEWERSGEGPEPRVNLRMEALVDILNGDILVMSHAYRQDEMLMLMRLAEEFGFRIHAFHHGVEAYKVAPELAAHGAAAAVWSDWGAFKIEAYDNTTYNARILYDAGVLVSLHSDDSQIASRMNWEAAKMLRTGLTEEQALGLVTINAARLLGVDERVGSLEAGKDGDFVIWNASPLSMEAHVEQTWIDGRRYFDIEEDQRTRAEVERERAALIQMIPAARREGGR